MPSSLIALGLMAGENWLEGELALGFMGSFALRLVTTYAIASLLFKNQQSSPQGTEIQLGPATDNKIPVVYGRRYAKPIITDAIISTDQKWMWYVLSFGETTNTDLSDINFGNIYYDGKLLIFDKNNPSEITGWYTQPKKHSRIGGQYTTKAAGKLSMWFYKNGSMVTGTTHNCYDMIDNGNNNFDIGTLYTGTTSIDAISLLQDNVTGGGIPSATQWTTATTMNNTVFAVIRLNYDSNSGIYGLGGMDAEIINTMNEPGTVIYDYLTNTSYGCGVDPANINVPSLLALNDTSNTPLTIVDTQGTTVTNTTTYQINGILDTTQDCLTNLNNLTDACDSWLQWDERLGQWGVIANISLSQKLQTNQISIASTTTTVLIGQGVIQGNNQLGLWNTSPIPPLGSKLDPALSSYFPDGTYVVDVTQGINGINYLVLNNSALQTYETGQPLNPPVPVNFYYDAPLSTDIARIVSTMTMRVITSDHIIGGINLTPTDLKASANQITVAFPNSDIINQVDYRYYWLEDQFKSPNEPVNNVDVNMPFVTDSIQATYLGYRKLWMSREDIIINFSMDYSGIGINAGDVIAIQHEWYGWEPGNYNGLYCPGRPFRVVQIKESKDNNGFLSVQITAGSYNDSIYYTMNPHFYTPDTFGMAIDAGYATAPGQPTTPASLVNPTPQYPNESVPYFVVSSSTPQSGIVLAMELWYGLTPEFGNTWQLLQTITGNEQGFGGTIPNSTPADTTYVNFVVSTIAAGSYYFGTRALSVNNQYGPPSVFSSPVFVWTPTVQAGTAVQATNSTNATNVNMNNGNGTFYITHSAATSGNSAQYASTNLTYNSTNQTLTTPNINIGSVASLTPISSAPSSPTTGMIAMATGTWGGLTTSTSYPTYYNGSVWKPMVS